MARIIGVLLFLAVMVHVIAATWLFIAALVITVVVVKQVRVRRRADQCAGVARLHHDGPPVLRAVPPPAAAGGPAPAYLRRWSVERRWYVAGDKENWDRAFRDAEVRARVCPAGPRVYTK